MTNTFVATETTYWIAHDEKRVYANGVAEDGDTVSSGQPFLETFLAPRPYTARLVELGGTP